MMSVKVCIHVGRQVGRWAGRSVGRWVGTWVGGMYVCLLPICIFSCFLFVCVDVCLVTWFVCASICKGNMHDAFCVRCRNVVSRVDLYCTSKFVHMLDVHAFLPRHVCEQCYIVLYVLVCLP